MADNALQGIIIHRSHKPLYVNRAWARLHGLTIEDVIAMPTLLNLAHQSEVERLKGYAADRLNGGDTPVRYRYRALHKSGRPIWLEQFVRVFDWRGEQLIQNTVIDVDDQERRADELRRQRMSMKQEAEQRSEALIRSNHQLHIHQSIIDQMSERISVIGTDYRFRMTNQANLQFRQRTREELMGAHVREAVGDAWFKQNAKAMLDRSFEGHTERYERATIGPDGNRCHVEITGEPFRDPDGTISGAIVSQRDVTAAKEAEEQLRLVASVVEQVSDRISVIGRDYRYRLTNKANRDYRQLPIEAFIGRPVYEVIGDEDFAKVKPALDRCFAGERTRTRRESGDAASCLTIHDVLLEPYREADGRISGAVVTLRDVTEAQRLSERLAYQARYDQLTGLINRRAFEQILEMSIVETAAGGRSDALCFIDLDQFKIVNDTVGHLVGDQLLQQVAKLLAGKLHEDDVLARLGGDEFGLLFRGCSLRRAKRAAEQLIVALKDLQFFHEGLMFEVGASIGITAINRHVTKASDIMAEVDLACYAAKDNGRNRVQIFKKRDVVMRRRREEMYRAGGIRAALDKDRFILFGQPIAPVTNIDDSADCVEILLRMKDERGRLIMPSAFIPAAERYGFMADVDRWVIRKTVAELVRRGTSLAGIDVCINLSGVTLNDETSLDFIRQILSLSNLLPEKISFEITETAAVRNIAKTRIFMDELRSWGCRFALDDFGSGVSSLTYLKRLPVDFLKIDGSFVCDVAKDRGSHAMVNAISRMAKDLGIRTIAEGVEDPSTLEVLKNLGIDYAQGFAVGRPEPLGETVRR
ncbi:MAG: EAL domain-containing protein [Geminicoccaceae bacterium]